MAVIQTPTTGIRLSTTVRILDLDGSLLRQRRLLERLGSRADIVDLRDLGRKIRYFASRRWMRVVDDRLRDDERDRLTLIGSGDYHHVTALLLRRFRDPLSVVVFDTHPDWDRTSPWDCCGSWVLKAIRLPNVHKIVMIGLGRCDLEGWRVNWGRTAHLLSNRIAFYPYDCDRSLGFGRARATLPFATFEPRMVYSEVRWRTVAGSDWKSLLREIVDGLATEDVYLSIDKDCLVAEDAITNWETGGLSLNQVRSAIRLLKEKKTIVGADITGEYSPVSIDNPLFRRLAARERPRLPVPTEADLLRNERTNLSLLDEMKLLPEVSGCSTR